MDRRNAVRLTALHLQKNTSENSETSTRSYSFLSVDWWKPTENGITGIHSHLVLSSIAYQAFRVREGHIARSCSISLVVRDNLHFPMLKNSNTGVGGTKIDSNCWSLRHVHTRDKRKQSTYKLCLILPCVMWKRQRHVTNSHALPRMSCVPGTGACSGMFFKNQCTTGAHWWASGVQIIRTQNRFYRYAPTTWYLGETRTWSQLSNLSHSS